MKLSLSPGTCPPTANRIYDKLPVCYRQITYKVNIYTLYPCNFDYELIIDNNFPLV